MNWNSRLASRSLVVVALVLMGSLSTGKYLFAQVGDADKFDGAVWRYTLTPKTKGLLALKGRYRVSGQYLYQKKSPDDEVLKKVVGKKVAAKQGKVRVEFDDFRGYTDRAGGSPPTQIKGSALLSYDRFGNWSGTFIDGDGRHWDFVCERIRE